LTTIFPILGGAAGLAGGIATTVNQAKQAQAAGSGLKVEISGLIGYKENEVLMAKPITHHKPTKKIIQNT
jgi:hypothetical protein